MLPDRVRTSCPSIHAYRFPAPGTIASLVGHPTAPLIVTHRALRQCYAAMKAGEPDPLVGIDTHGEQHALHATIYLATLLPIERRTVER